MKLSCKVIEDMLPMYYDGICSEDSAALVEEHLKKCQHCRQVLSDLRADVDLPENIVDDIKPLKQIQKTYKKMRLGWLIAIICVLVLMPVAFLIGNKRGENAEPPVEFTQDEAVAYANAFMTCLVEKDYATAYSYLDIEELKKDLLSGNLFSEDELVNFEADGLKKFCEGGEKLESWGGIQSFELVEISDAGYFNTYGTEEYLISYTVKFDGEMEGFGVSLTKNGIDHLSSGGGLINHPLSHLTRWVQWVADDYNGQYYDFNLGKWVQYDKEA